MHAAAVKGCWKFGGRLKLLYFQEHEYSYIVITASGKINFIFYHKINKSSVY